MIKLLLAVMAVCVIWREGNEYYVAPAPGHENDMVIRQPMVSWGDERISEFHDWIEALRFFADRGRYMRRVEILRVAANPAGSCLSE